MRFRLPIGQKRKYDICNQCHSIEGQNAKFQSQLAHDQQDYDNNDWQCDSNDNIDEMHLKMQREENVRSQEQDKAYVLEHRDIGHILQQIGQKRDEYIRQKANDQADAKKQRNLLFQQKYEGRACNNE